MHGFRSEGRNVICVSTISEARDQLLLFKPALILMDINLPDGSGLDLLGEVKKEDRNIPVIMLTANDTDSDIVRGLELGADDYITKPFSLSVLRARVPVPEDAGPSENQMGPKNLFFQLQKRSLSA